jgi:L-ascorbate metabolism protein UlaG (beta-lactamase superfamily)
MKIRWFGQFAFLLSDSVRVAIDPFGDVDVLMLPIGGGPTVGGDAAAAIVRELVPAARPRSTLCSQRVSVRLSGS